MLPTADFLLTLAGEPGAVTVAARAPGDVPLAPVPFRLDASPELQADLRQLEQGVAPERTRLEAIGSQLFRALLPPPILAAYERARGAAQATGQTLRLRVDSQSPAAARLPWEFLFHPEERRFLAIGRSVPLLRTLVSTTAVAPLRTQAPLRLLYVQANPRGTRPLDLEASKRTLQAAVGERIVVEVLPVATATALREELGAGRGYHILHYDGHGHFDAASGEGALALHGPDGKRDLVGGERLAAYLEGTLVRLVVLAACETGRDAATASLAGVAHELMRTSPLPAVVAMQYKIRDNAARAFVGGFYGALDAGHPVEAAVVEGRLAILEGYEGEKRALATPDWAAPVLYLRGADGYLFDDTPKATMAESNEESTPPSGGGIRFGNDAQVRGDVFTGGKHINTAGGAHVEGGVNVSGGDFVARDKVNVSDGFYQPDMKVAGNNYQAGGDMTVRQGGDSASALAQLFDELRERVAALPEDDQPLAETIVGQVEAQAQKIEAGDDSPATQSLLEKKLRQLAGMAGDMAEVAVATFANPAAGFTLVLQKIAWKVQQQEQQS